MKIHLLLLKVFCKRLFLNNMLFLRKECVIFLYHLRIKQQEFLCDGTINCWVECSDLIYLQVSRNLQIMKAFLTKLLKLIVIQTLIFFMKSICYFDLE